MELNTFFKKHIPTWLGITIILATVAVLFGGAFAYKYINSYPFATGPLIIENNKTSGWKTYTNTEYGFEIKYPNSLSFTIGEYPNLNYWYVKFFYGNNSDESHLVIRVEKSSLGQMSVKNSKGTLPGKIIAGAETTILIGDASGKCQDTFLNTENWSYIFSNHCRQDNLFDNMISTFKLITPEKDQFGNLIPKIYSISPASGPKGTVVEIRGIGLSGFEGDLDVYFEKPNGKKVMLTDTFGDYVKTQDKLIKVVLVEPCQPGEKVYGRYSGIESECNFVELTPGMYKVYIDHLGTKSNIVNFEITAMMKYVEARAEMLANGWMPLIPEIYGYESGTIKSQNPIDPNFPEIWTCGTGIDQVCMAGFKKGDETTHLMIQVGGRPPYGPYSEWTVIGNE